MHLLLKKLNRACKRAWSRVWSSRTWKRAWSRMRRFGMRANRTFRRLSLRGKLIVCSTAALCVALVITCIALLARGGNTALA